MDVKTCRVCCDAKGKTQIFDDTADITISSKIMSCCANLTISYDDGLPKHICDSCEDELESCYRFALKCKVSDKKLRAKALTSQELQSNDIKVEVKTEEVNSDGDNALVIDFDEADDFSLINVFKQTKLSSKIKQSNDLKSVKGPKKNRIRKKYNKDLSSQCSVCGRVCLSPSTLSAHMRSHTGEKPYKCQHCDKQYKDLGGVNRHTSRCHYPEKRERNFICDMCGKGFLSKYAVRIHIRIHTGETPYKCPLCTKRFTQISTMQRHKKRHTAEKDYACETCSKSFVTKEELKNHLGVHSNEKKYTCPQCNVMFKYENSLKKHIKRHLEPNSFICNFCGKTFNTSGNLKNHTDRQHSEKSGYCGQCSKHVSNFEVHMWRHNNQRPLKCELCTSSFYEPRALAHHVNFRHKNTDKYKCQVEGCHLTFPSKHMLEFHTAKLHTNQILFPCEICSRGFYRKNDLARHMIGTHKQRLLQ